MFQCLGFDLCFCLNSMCSAYIKPIDTNIQLGEDVKKLPVSCQYPLRSNDIWTTGMHPIETQYMYRLRTVLFKDKLPVSDYIKHPENRINVTNIYAIYAVFRILSEHLKK